MCSFPGKRVALIVGGVTPNDIIPTSEAELIDLDDPTTTCQPIPPYPSGGGIAAGVGLLYLGLLPTVCGGIVSKASVSSCFSYSFSYGAWALNGLLGNMTVPRQEFGGTLVGEDVFTLSGGAKTTQSGLDNFWKSSELAQVSGGGGFYRGPDLPTENFGHCMVSLGSTRVFIAGGFFTPNTAYVYDTETGTMSDPLQIPGPHSSHVCGSFKNATTGLREVVVVGGDEGISKSSLNFDVELFDKIEASSAKDETHIFSPSTMTFREGPRFPYAVSYAAAIQDGGDSFIVSGGTDGTLISDYLVRFDPATETFQVMSQRMASARSQHMAIYVDAAPVDICA